MEILGAGKIWALGFLDIDQGVEKRLQEGDVLWLNFKLKDSLREDEWKAKVIPFLPWARSGEVTILIRRPRMPANENASPAEKKKDRPYVTGDLPAAASNVGTDYELRAALDRAKAIAVKIRVESSHLTAKRQMYALNTLVQARTQVPSQVEVKKAKYVADERLKNWQKRLLN